MRLTTLLHQQALHPHSVSHSHRDVIDNLSVVVSQRINLYVYMYVYMQLLNYLAMVCCIV